jgi:hypothetical protein
MTHKALKEPQKTKGLKSERPHFRKNRARGSLTSKLTRRGSLMLFILSRVRKFKK